MRYWQDPPKEHSHRSPRQMSFLIWQFFPPHTLYWLTFIIMTSRDPSVDESRGYKHGYSSGPALSIILSNTEGLTGAKQEFLAWPLLLGDLLTSTEVRFSSVMVYQLTGHPWDTNDIVLSIGIMEISVSPVYKPSKTIFDIHSVVTNRLINVVIATVSPGVMLKMATS